jgi:hypothetical protein
MLVYGSSFKFESDGGPKKIIDCIARWAGFRAQRSAIDSNKLAKGINELRLKDGCSLTSRVTVDAAGLPTYPYFFCAQLSHGDNQVPGRRWMTEIGMRQDSPDDEIFCTILVKTDEISARVTAPIQTTRPKIVEQLTQLCRPSGFTPGLKVKSLDESSAKAFLHEVERSDRYWPMVIISSSRDGKYPVTPDRIRSLLVGIADVVEVSNEADTFQIEKILGRRYGAWGGAINIVFQPRVGERGSFCETVMYRPNELSELEDDGRLIETEILTAVTHRTNLPASWRHISLERVTQAAFRSQLTKAILGAKQNDETAEYAELLVVADAELNSKEQQIASLRADVEDREGQISMLNAKIEGLKYSLSGQQTATNSSNDDMSVLGPLRNAIGASITDDPTLENSLKVISMLFSDRVIVLDTAFDSAQDSDEESFKYGSRAYGHLWKLSTVYWQSLADGLGDQHAKMAFGHKTFAQNEGEALTSEGKKRRTFIYRDKEYLMEKHLKIGVKDSSSETLRIHFEWLAEEQRLLIGHCGKHLDF